MNPSSNPLLRPGVWLMRRWRLGGRLACLALASAWPLLAAMALSAADAALAIAPVTVVGLALLIYLLLAFRSAFLGDFQRVHDAMAHTAGGNLRAHLSVDGHDELADLARLLDRMIGSLSAMVAEVRSNSALVAHAGRSLAVGNRDLAERTEQQAANLEQTAASVQQLTGAVAQNAQTAGDSDRQAAQVRDVAERGAGSMQQAVQTVEGIQKGAAQMNEIIGVIDSLARPTSWRSTPPWRPPVRVSRAVASRWWRARCARWPSDRRRRRARSAG